jgi:hypothetical protein
MNKSFNTEPIRERVGFIAQQNITALLVKYTNTVKGVGGV